MHLINVYMTASTRTLYQWKGILEATKVTAVASDTHSDPNVSKIP